MTQQVQRVRGKHLEQVAERVFGKHFHAVFYNDYSPICAMIGIVDTDDIMMDSIRELAYYGYNTTAINKQSAGFLIHVYRDQNGLPEKEIKQ